VELRLAQPSDAPKWVELFKLCYGNDYPYKQIYDPVYVSSILDPASGDQTLLVVNGDDIRASITLLSCDEFTNNPVINLARPLFHPESYQEGSAKGLIHQLCEIAKENKNFVVTRVPVYDAEQQGLFEDCGFKCVGYQPNKHLINTHKGFLFYVLKNPDIIGQRMVVSGSLSQVGALAMAVFENFGIVNRILIRDNIAGYPLETEYEIVEATGEEFQIFKLQSMTKNWMPEISTGANRGHGFLRLPSNTPVQAYLGREVKGSETKVLAGITYFYDDIDKCIRILDGFSNDDITLGALLQKVVNTAREKYSAAYVEIDILAISPMLLKCAEQIGFTPVAYFPGFYRVGEHVSDVVKMVKINVNYEPEKYQHSEQTFRIAKIIDDNFRDQKTGVAIINLLRTLPVFRGLGDGELRKISKVFVQKLYRPGEIIFKQGAPGEEAYVVMRGQVDICLSAETKPIASIKTGQVFGEQAFLDGSPRTAMAVATQPSILLIVRRDEFTRLMQREPNLGMVIMRNIAIDLSNKLRMANRTIMERKQIK